jgi:ethanolamine utilization protein EutA
MKPAETIRATVIGAGIHTMELSGSTVEYTANSLPVKNVPIIKLSPEEEREINGKFPLFSGAVSEKINWYKEENGYQTVALSFKGVKNPTYKQVLALSEALCTGVKDYLAHGLPLIVVVEADMAKALGQTIRIQTHNKASIVCIDCVSVESGDYIDIGSPFADGRVTPVVIKTLALNA